MTKKQQIIEFIKAFLKKNNKMPSGEEILSEVDVNKTYAYKVMGDWKKISFDEDSSSDEKEESINLEESVTADYKDDSGTISTKSPTIKTLDDALREGKVDLNVWEVERHVINFWTTPMKITDKQMDSFRRDGVEFHVETSDGEHPKNNWNRKKAIKVTNAKAHSDHTETPVLVTNYQVKVWLRRKKPNKIEEVIKGLIKTIPQLSNDILPITLERKPDENVAAEIGLYDAHIGKFAWHPETLMGHWDLDIAKKVYLDGCKKGLESASGFHPSKIFFVIGQDYMHVDNSSFKTSHGQHTLDADGRWPKIARVGMETVITAVNMCKQLAPVEVKWVPGNHDLNSSFWLSLILEQAFKNDKYVNIDNTPSQRKAVLWGNLLVGWWHDASGRKMPASINALAQWWPELWGQSKFRELHIGHKHKKVHTKTMPIETTGGVLIRQIPSLSSIDYWHHDQLFVDAVPASETLLWSKDSGVFGNFTINVNPVEE